MKYFFTAFILAMSFTAQAHHNWHTIKQPTNSPAQVYGGYTTGCMDGAMVLPDKGTGFIKVRKERYRQFGHPDLIHFIEHLGLQVYQQGLGNLLISDLAQPRGGFNPGSSHKSHTSGLDVDIWFKRESSDDLTEPEIHVLQPYNLVASNRIELDENNWEQHDTVLQLAAKTPSVTRIFVHPFIKKRLCEVHAGQDWLGKIRAWWGHNSHFHVRLACPIDSPDCVPQDPPPVGDGCDSDYIDYWVNRVTPKKAITKPKKKNQKIVKKPAKKRVLHPECEHIYDK